MDRRVSSADLAAVLGSMTGDELRDLQASLGDLMRRRQIRYKPDQRTLFDYWGPRGFALDYPIAPGVDYYRLVDDDEEAMAAIAAGELPLHGHRGMDPDELTRQQTLQYEGPNRLYARDAAGHVVELDSNHEEDDYERPFVPIYNSEGFPAGNPENRRMLMDYLRRSAPYMLERPGTFSPPPPQTGPQGRNGSTGAMLAAALLGSARPQTVDLVAALTPPRIGSTPLHVAHQWPELGRGEQGAMVRDARERALRGIPSFNLDTQMAPQPPNAIPPPMPQVIPWDSGPTTPPLMPIIPPEWLGVPAAPAERVDMRGLPSLLGGLT